MVEFYLILECALSMPKDADGTEYITSCMVGIHKCNAGLSSKKKYCEAIMDNLLLFISDKKSHNTKLEDFLKALLKNGLKISPKKYQLFKRELQYICSNILIKGKKVEPLRINIDAI